MRNGLLALSLAALLLPGPGAGATSHGLDDARSTHAEARAEVRRLSRQALLLAERYRAMADRRGLAAARFLDAYRAELGEEARLAEARDRLNLRASAAYRSGPAAFVSAFLRLRPSEISSARMYLERTIFGDIDTTGDVARSLDEAHTRRVALEGRKDAVLRGLRQMEALRERAEAGLADARAAARKAGIRARALEEARAAIADSPTGDPGVIDALLGADQTDLLALLGPNQGRGCEIPPGLKPAAGRIEGTASWYGWGFAGNPTATGAIYDPRLFTAAHKTLPLNSFLRVRYGGTCAIVLVNDRGPFHLDWILDMSQASARYLGYDGAGTAHIVGEVLMPREPVG